MQGAQSIIKKNTHASIEIEARQNIHIKNWIKKVENNKVKNFENDKKILLALNISEKLKVFMLKNLKEKYKYFWNSNIKEKLPKENRRKKRSSFQNQGGYGVVSVSSNPYQDLLIEKGKNYRDIHDYTFKNDVVFIGWSTNKILKFILDNSDPRFRRAFNAINNIKYEKNAKEINLLTIKSSLEGASIATSLIQLSRNIPRLYANIRNLFAFCKAINIGTLAPLTTVLSVINDLVQNPNENGVNKLIRIAINLSAIYIPLALSTLGPVGMVGGVIISAAKLLINLIPSGTGYTLWDNWNDQGLNDFNYQMSKNQKMMAKIALYYSYGLNNGIVWKISDGWFHTPRLYISKQGDSERGERGRFKPITSDWERTYVNISGKNIFNNSFNWGNKVSFSENDDLVKSYPTLFPYEYKKIIEGSKNSS